MEFHCPMTNGKLKSVESGYSKSLAQEPGEPDPIQILHWCRSRAGRSATFRHRELAAKMHMGVT
jgi:hypothetical protein